MSKSSGTGQGYFPPGYGFQGDSPPHDYDPTTAQLIKDIKSGKAHSIKAKSIQQDLLNDLTKFSIKPPSIGGDACNITIQSNGSIFGLKIPPSPITLRNPACALPPPPPPLPIIPANTSKQSIPYVPPPRGNNSFYVAIANGSHTESWTYSDNSSLDISASVEVDCAFVDFRYPLDVYEVNGGKFEGYIDIIVNGNPIAAYFRNDSINPFYTPEERGAFQFWEAYSVGASAGNQYVGISVGFGVCFFILNFQCALQFAQNNPNDYFSIVTQTQGGDFDGGDITTYHTLNSTWTIFEVYGNNKPYYPPPSTPPPLPTMSDCCNCDLLKAIYAQVKTLPSPIPMGWNIRPEYGRPQGIFQFAQIDGSGNIIGSPKYVINVPHLLNNQSISPLPNYTKGNWEIIYVLNDNSRITINALDETNGMTVLNAIIPLLNSNFTSSAYLSKNSLVKTKTPINQTLVKCRICRFYSQGALSDVPDWIATF